jgi:hypothetical protein
VYRFVRGGLLSVLVVLLGLHAPCICSVCQSPQAIIFGYWVQGVKLVGVLSALLPCSEEVAALSTAVKEHGMALIVFAEW